MVKRIHYTQAADAREDVRWCLHLMRRDGHGIENILLPTTSEFLKDVIIYQFINISPFIKASTGNTLIGYDTFHVFQAIGTNNVQ